ncbi:MAG: putative metal-binding motif-containing protein, partial [Myxococcota bacterium]|nr:putative metal-binding motif-containing protein [Myxococcota bacterium]
QPGLACLPQGDGTAVCATFSEGVCLPCVIDADCATTGAECLEMANGERFCGAACAGDSDCPTGFDCDGGQCTPWTLSCTCSDGLLGATLGCENQGLDGLCTGVMICQLDGWSKCSASPPMAELCDGVDNDCDGFIDEQPYYVENGQQLPFGSLCGVGQCAGGEVVCAPDGTATCSTNGLATQEACADNEDNDCDGQINEDCDSLDFDGDGVPNSLDCNPIDSEIYQGASEPCCPAGADLATCDKNCDNAALACAACDADGDGSCPPDDCNDADPNVYPGAPEKCNDGVDQDCQGGDINCTAANDTDHDNWIPPADCNEGNPSVHPLAPELCDNLDNDCDGLTDEGNPQAGQPCGTSDEYCQEGVLVCTHYLIGAAIHCQGEILFEAEKCDGIDNDCNGATDETFPGLGSACDGPDTDDCAHGTTVCLGDGSATVCADESVTNLYEVCNGVDDDCNGATDEFVCPLYDLDADGLTVDEGDCDDHHAGRYPGAPEPCCDPALGAEGATLCDMNCDEIVTPCALTDLDADGYTEGQGDCDDSDPHTHPGAVEKCGDGIDQDCLAGDLSCATVSDVDGDGFHSGVDCNDTNHAVNHWAKEDCNYIDDDCDGQIDEGNPTGQIGTCGPDVPECSPGTWVCVHDDATSTFKVMCITDNFQAPELCNGLDDDCDGEVDEVYFDLGMPCDGPDSDQCEHGALVCNADGSGVVCGE